MNSAAHLAWPFFDESHRSFKDKLQTWTRQQFAELHGHDESREAIDRECVRLVKALGQGGWLKPAIAGQLYGGTANVIDTRTICICAKNWLGTMVWQTLRLPCKAWGRVPSV